VYKAITAPQLVLSNKKAKPSIECIEVTATYAVNKCRYYWYDGVWLARGIHFYFHAWVGWFLIIWLQESLSYLAKKSWEDGTGGYTPV